MPSINKEDKTITWVCEAADEAQTRVDLQELLDKNPGYTPVLTVEDTDGKETKYTTLEVRTRRRAASTVASQSEEAADPDYYEEEDNQTS